MVQKFLNRKNSTLENVKLVPIFVQQEMNSFLFCDRLKRHWPLDSRSWIVLKVDRCEFWFETDNTSRHLDESHLRLTFLWERPYPFLKGQCVPNCIFKVSKFYQNNLPPSSQFYQWCQWSKRRKLPLTVSLKKDSDKILILFLFQCAAAALARLSRWQKPRYFHLIIKFIYIVHSILITSCLFIFINILTSTYLFCIHFHLWILLMNDHLLSIDHHYLKTASHSTALYYFSSNMLTFTCCVLIKTPIYYWTQILLLLTVFKSHILMLPLQSY